MKIQALRQRKKKQLFFEPRLHKGALAVTNGILQLYEQRHL